MIDQIQQLSQEALQTSNALSRAQFLAEQVRIYGTKEFSFKFPQGDCDKWQIEDLHSAVQGGLVELVRTRRRTLAAIARELAALAGEKRDGQPPVDHEFLAKACKLAGQIRKVSVELAGEELAG